MRNAISVFLGNFSVLMNKDQMNALLDTLIKRLENSKEIHDTILNLVVVNSIAKTSGSRHNCKLFFYF